MASPGLGRQRRGQATPFELGSSMFSKQPRGRSAQVWKKVDEKEKANSKERLVSGPEETAVAPILTLLLRNLKHFFNDPDIIT